jgi:diguanylate cyclase (GGDEF)-like protein
MSTRDASAATMPGMLDTQRIAIDRYWRFARISMLIAIGLHIGFAVVGVLLNTLPLVLLQVVSVSIYGSCYLMSCRGIRGLVTPLVWLDLIGHATIACLIFGVDSGFQFHSWILMPLVFANASRNIRTKLAMALVLSVLYMIVDWWLRRTTPQLVMDPLAMNALRYFNISTYLAALGGMAYVYARTVKQVENKLRVTAGTDSLTGLINRRRMSDRLQQEISRARIEQQPLSVILLDIDEFKSINDRYGHNRGDEVIKRVGDVLLLCVRDKDLVARWGGEEFLILLPSTTIAAAHELSERLRRQVAITVSCDDLRTRAVTITIGVAQWHPGESLEETIHRADQALYLGKNAGRNRVVVDGAAAA